MDDKTPLELARGIVNAECPSGMGWAGVSRKVAAALIERMTPVEIGLSGKRHGYCPCGQNVATWYAFCVKCGVPIQWK